VKRLALGGSRHGRAIECRPGDPATQVFRLASEAAGREPAVENRYESELYIVRDLILFGRHARVLVLMGVTDAELDDLAWDTIIRNDYHDLLAAKD